MIYSSEIRQLMNDNTLPSYLDEKGMEVDCLNWWQSIESKYPVTFKMVSAVLSIFHGPRVESSYSMMTDIIDTKSGRMNIETYDALQTVKYSLMANQPTTSTDKPLAVTMFHREDKLTSPVNPTLARNMRSAYEAYNDVTTAKRKLKEAERKEFGISSDNKKTKKNVIEENELEVAESVKEHNNILEKAYSTKRQKVDVQEQPMGDEDEDEDNDLSMLEVEVVPTKKKRTVQPSLDAYFGSVTKKKKTN